MPNFEILATETGADDAGENDKGQQLIKPWVQVTLKIHRGFDWEKLGPGLLKKLRAATELYEQ